MNKLPYLFRKVGKTGKLMYNSFKGLEGKYILVIPLKITSKKEKDNFLNRCKVKTDYCAFHFLGKNCCVYTNGFTQQLKPMIPLIKENVLNDCIRNPAKYLKEVK